MYIPEEVNIIERKKESEKQMKTISSKVQNEISEEIRGWYESSRELIPSISSLRFANFLGTSSALAAESSKGNSFSYRFIIDAKSPTAYINKSEMTIAIPAWYFSEEALSQLTSISEDEGLDLESLSLALVNGSQIHEGLHALHTPTTMQEFINQLDGPSAAKLKDGGELANTVMNVTEDFYIEARGRADVGQAVMQFVEMKNALLFSESDFLKNIDTMKTSKNEEEILLARINFYTAMKNLGLRELARTKRDNPIVEGLYSIATELSAISRRENYRATFMARAYDIITRGISREAIKKVNTKMGGGSGEKKMLIEMDPDLFEGELELSEEEMEKLQSIAAEFESSAERTQKVTKMEFEKRTIMPSSSKFSYHGYKTQYVDDIFTVPENAMPALDRPSADYSFLSLLRQLRSRNHTPGAARKSGTNIVGSRLYRIGTDEKIFARKDMVDEKEHKVQVAILIDASGSMGHMYHQVMSEAASIFTALKKSSIPVSAYAHTGMPRSHSIPALYRIASSGTDSNNYDITTRFTRALSIDLNQNYDGVILDALSSIAFRGTPDATKKIIFVLSDGYPEGDGYIGESANRHTKDVIANLRARGFYVIALSLVNHVVANNDIIYGKDMNVDASKNMKSRFEALIIRLQKEGTL